MTKDADGHRVVRDAPKPKAGKVKPHLPSVIDRVQAAGLGTGSDVELADGEDEDDDEQDDEQAGQPSHSESDEDTSGGSDEEDDDDQAGPVAEDQVDVEDDHALPPSKRRKLAHVLPEAE